MWVVRSNGVMVNLNQATHVAIVGDRLECTINGNLFPIHEDKNRRHLELVYENVISDMANGENVCDLRGENG